MPSDKSYLSCAETAKLVRGALKRAFPGQKFSVRSHTYSGGASIDVAWTDGPLEGDVDQVVQVYAGAGFDGMIDLKTYNTDWLFPDGTVRAFQTNGGHSYGDTIYDAEQQERVSEEWKRDYTAGLTRATEQTRWTQFDAGSPAYAKGRDDRDRLDAQGARLVHFGADFIFTRRERSPEEEARLQEAVLVLSGSKGPFSYNDRYSVFGVELQGSHTGYGNDMVHRLARVARETVDIAVMWERERPAGRVVGGMHLVRSGEGELSWEEVSA